MKTRLLLSIAALLAIFSCKAQTPGTGKDAVLENIMTRASVRSFTTQAVEPEKIETMLRSGMAAPTAMNKQAWHFVVVTDKDKRKAIQQYESPLAIVVCGDKNKGKDFWIADAALASENILLTAHALGLGAVWTAVYPNEGNIRKVRDILQLPDYLIPLNTIIIGYPAAAPQVKDKWKPENISYNTFGGKQ